MRVAQEQVETRTLALPCPSPVLLRGTKEDVPGTCLPYPQDRPLAPT